VEVEIRVPVGPQHPAFKEPINFLLSVVGERIIDVKPRLGYNHRGIEKAAETRNYYQNLELVERICGICPVCHSLAFCQGVERLYEIEAPHRAQYIRTIMAELERLHSHSLWIGFLMQILGFETAFMHIWRDRELILNLYESITGNRVHHSLNTLGGVRRDLTTNILSKIAKTMKIFKTRVEHYKSVFCREPSVIKRTRGIGILPVKDSLQRFAVGPVLRSCGVKKDIRRDFPYAAYEDLTFNVITKQGCDVEARLHVRINEMTESLEIIKQCLLQLPSGAIKMKIPRRPIIGETLSRVEASRGELFYFILSDGKQQPYRLKVRTPTLANFSSLQKMLENAHLADVPVIISSIDPCISCCERVQIVDRQTGMRKIWNAEDFRRYALNWYQN
jgi:NADH-quinone oxidoreductase subunit D